MAHPIENIMKTTMEQLKEMVDVNTIIGDPVMTGGDTVIVPVSRVCLGFLSGGGEYCSKKKGEGKNENHQMDTEENRHPFAGTSVAGLNLTPMAFLAITGGVVRVLPAHYDCTLDRIIEMVPETVRELDRIVKEVCQCRQQNQNSNSSQTLHTESTVTPE
jgi:sporulation protein YtfJ